MLRYSMRVLPLALIVSGCSAVATDVVSVALSDTNAVEVDSNCQGDCVDPVSVQITFEENLVIDPSEVVEFRQYKVDYAFDGYQVSSFAAADISQTLVPGEIAFLDIYPASWEQQDEVYAAVGGDRITGTATLTLEGYDWRNENLQVSTQFSISFEDLAED